MVGKNPWEGGTLHRLDSATSGLVVFAKTQSFYDSLSAIQAKGGFAKTYIARTTTSDALVTKESPILASSKASSKTDAPSTTVQSYFRSYGPKGREVRPTLDIKRADSEPLYSTLVQRFGSINEGSSCDNQVFYCTIVRGFRHQIRAHLAWLGYPIVGDSLYGKSSSNGPLMLQCIRISFPYKGNTFVYCTAPEALFEGGLS